MTAAELIIVRACDLPESELLMLLADAVYEATLKDGRRVLDVMDFREWLVELSVAAKIEADIMKPESSGSPA